jgi:hypothetical protein
LEGEETAFDVDIKVLVEGGLVHRLERQHPSDAGVQKREVDSAKALLELVRDADRVAQRPSVRFQD